MAIEAPSASDQYLLFKVNDTESGLVEIGRLQGASDPWWGIGSFYALRSGSVGIGTNTPSAQFHTTGTLRHANFGAGAATFDANGNISSVSDERLKIIVGTFTAGLAELMGINPILHKYNELSGLDMENVYAGFSAQNVMQFIPEAVGQDS